MRSKLIIIVGVLLALVSSSHANVSFKWANLTTGSATYWNGAAYANAPSGYTVLTYISGDTTINFDVAAPIVTSYGSGVGVDKFVGATNILSLGKLYTPIYTVGDLGDSAGSYVNGYAYCVLVAMPLSTFQGTWGNDVTQLPVGTLFGVSGISAKLTRYDPPEGGSYGTTQLFATTTAVADIALVPEPSTFALLGIGLGLVGLRRFRRAS